MNLIIAAPLCEPPTEISCFRDVTLYAKTFIFDDILINCTKGTRSLYWNWLKNHGAHDFISDLIGEHEKEHGFTISPKGGNLTIDRINAFNLNFVVSCLNTLKK